MEARWITTHSSSSSNINNKNSWRKLEKSQLFAPSWPRKPVARKLTMRAQMNWNCINNLVFHSIFLSF